MIHCDAIVGSLVLFTSLYIVQIPNTNNKLKQVEWARFIYYHTSSVFLTFGTNSDLIASSPRMNIVIFTAEANCEKNLIRREYRL